MGAGLDILTGGASSLISAGLGIAGQAFGNKTQLEQQKKLMEEQARQQHILNKRNQELNIEQWDKTNAQAQEKHYNDAGLNVGLMYGGGGGGGGTTGNASGSLQSASAEGGSATVQNILAIEAQKANVALMNAQAKKAEAEAKNISGVDKDFKTAQLTEQQFKNWLNENSKDAQINQIVDQAKLTMYQGNNESVKGAINQATQFEQQERIKTDALTAILNNKAIQSNIHLNEAKINEIVTKLLQNQEGLENERRGQDISKENNERMVEGILWSAGINATGNLVNSIINIKNLSGKAKK